mgnify:CR=1 FL=1
MGGLTMAKAVLISIRPEWVEKIANGEKTIEVRKTRPKLETPFKVYIYCTNQKNIMLWNARSYIYVDDHNHNAFDRCWNGSVVGEFVCDRIDTINPETEPYGIYDVDDDFVAQTRLVDGALWDYGKSATLYGWHISDLKIYDKLRELREFKKINRDCFYAELGIAKRDCPDCKNSGCFLERPPQSWRYVEELGHE